MVKRGIKTEEEIEQQEEEDEIPPHLTTYFVIFGMLAPRRQAGMAANPLLMADIWLFAKEFRFDFEFLLKVLTVIDGEYLKAQDKQSEKRQNSPPVNFVKPRGTYGGRNS